MDRPYSSHSWSFFRAGSYASTRHKCYTTHLGKDVLSIDLSFETKLTFQRVLDSNISYTALLQLQ